jgi:hypothetical protein
MSAFFTWGLATAHTMSGSGGYAGPSSTPDDLRRLMGGCDPQVREKPTLSVDLFCGNAPDGVFADQADFLAVANSRMPVGFAKVVCPAASSLPDYLTGVVLLECLRSPQRVEIDLELNTDPRVKGKFGISIVERQHP